MICTRIALPIISSIFLFGASQVSAAMFNLSDSGNLLATLDVTQNSNTEYQFSLNFLSNGGSSNFSFIDSLVIDSTPATPPSSLGVQSTTGNVSDPLILGSGITPDTSFGFDYGFEFADSGNGRFAVGESIQWLATFGSGPVSFEDLGVVFRNNGGQQPKDVFAVAAAPIPEPQTYAMFLAGLGLMGFAARRKQG